MKLLTTEKGSESYYGKEKAERQNAWKKKTRKKQEAKCMS